MIKAKYMNEAPGEQSDGVLLDEYARCAADLHEGPLGPFEFDAVGEYVIAVRDEIVRRMRAVE